MSIEYNDRNHTFTLQTCCSTYQMKIDPHGTLLHTYYGKKMDSGDHSYAICYADTGFSGNPYDAGKDRTYSFDSLPLEYPCDGSGDYRITALSVQYSDGACGCDLRYLSHKIEKGKYSLQGLPALFDQENSCSTLTVTLKDRFGGLQIKLLYSVFEAFDLITRAAVIENTGDSPVWLHKAASAAIDYAQDDWQMLHFYGRHTMERLAQRTNLPHGEFSIGSTRGTSSHQHNPFAVFCTPDTTEDFGCCYGVSLLYSGGFRFQAEVDQLNRTRAVFGIDDDAFAWKLEKHDSFTAPEVCLSFSDKGFAALSGNLHQAFRKHLIRSTWKDKMRPVVINNWEATYFDFTADKIVDIAHTAAALGIDLLVLDDGWFGKRQSDYSGLGDWIPNEAKLGCTLPELVRRVNQEGLQFGLWFEPEMVSEDSDLYREHPDWAMKIPNRDPVRGRYQLVLDLSRPEVCADVEKRLFEVLDSAPIRYLKWDMNRSLCDFYSTALPADRQGEVKHRYVLGLYRILEDMLARYPDLLLEGCSGGGGRFDAGMLYYAPQIWCSDNTDAIARTAIQYGTSFAYPMSSISAHVSVCPNHQNGRTTPLKTRGICAMQGTFGYEMDLNRLSDEEKEMVAAQVKRFHAHWKMFETGRYYRLTNLENHRYFAWEYASETEAALAVVFLDLYSNAAPVCIKWKGLLDEAQYKVAVDDMECGSFSGAQLMNIGLPVSSPKENYDSCWIYAVKL